MNNFNVAHQATTFLMSCLLGVCLCAFYDLFRILRLSVRHNKIATFFEDILFFSISGMAVYCFLIMRCLGEVRFYVLLGALFGFIFWYCTVSRLCVFLVSRSVKVTKKTVKRILKPIGRTKNKIIHFLRKKVLQPARQVLYNWSNNRKKRVKRTDEEYERETQA